MKEKSIISGLSWTLVGELVNKATLFFATMYFAKILSAENYGLFSLMQATAMYSVMLIEVSPTMYGIREVAKCETNSEVLKKAEEIYSLRIFAGLIVSLVYITTLYLLKLDENSFSTGLAFSLYIIAYTFFSDWLHKGLENFKGVAIASLAQATLFIPLVFLFVNDAHSLVSAAYIWSGSFIVFSAALYFLQKNLLGMRLKFKLQIHKWKKNILESYHFVLNGVLGMAYQFIPLFLLSYFSTMVMVGSFSLMYKLTFAVCGLAYYIPSVFYPKLSRCINDDLEQFKKLQKKLLVVMGGVALVFIGLSILGKDFFIAFFDKNKYSSLSELYNIFSLLVVAYLLRFSFNIPLFAMGKQHIITKQMGYASLLVTIIGFPLVFYKHAVGAAYSVLIGELLIVTYAASIYYLAINNKKSL